MYKTAIATPTGQFIHSQVFDPSMVTRMMQLSDHGHPALVALTDALPANLANRFKRLAGHLVRRVMREHRYALVPRRRCRIPGSSLFKTGACYRAVSHTPRQEGICFSAGGSGGCSSPRQSTGLGGRVTSSGVGRLRPEYSGTFEAFTMMPTLSLSCWIPTHRTSSFAAREPTRKQDDSEHNKNKAGRDKTGRIAHFGDDNAQAYYFAGVRGPPKRTP